MNNKRLKARIYAIDYLLKKYGKDEEKNRLLSNGFVPDELKQEYSQVLEESIEKYDDSELSDLQLSTYSTFLHAYPEKVIGEEVAGSGFINPVITKGDITKLGDIIFDYSGAGKISAREEAQEDAGIVAAVEESPQEKGLSLLLAKKLLERKENKSFDSTDTDGVYSVQDSIKVYNQGISDNEIKAWVYYKKLFGNPMRGWENYFIGYDENLFNTVIISTETIDIKDNHFRFLRRLPAGSSIGSKTKFSNEYDGETYLVVRTEANELVYVPKSKTKETSVSNSATQASIDTLVKEKALCYYMGYYLPIPIYTFGNIYDIEDSLLGTYDRELGKRSGGDYEKIESMYGKEIADWHVSLVSQAKTNKGELIFQDPRPSHRPFLSTNSELASDENLFSIKELNEEAGVDFKRHYESKYSRKRYDQSTTYSLVDAFKAWFEVTVNDTMLQGTTKGNVLDLFFKAGRIEGNVSEKEKDEIRLSARVEGERMFSEFLATALTPTDTALLNTIWNRQYNAVSKLDYTKVPIGFEVNKNVFSVGTFRLKKAQSDGISFMSLTNGGCLAYDVGYGKTLTAIFNLSSLLSQGKIKRPLVAVPKPVYNNWIREMFGFWTDGDQKSFDKFEGARFVNGALTGTRFKLNSWYNLSDSKIISNTIIPEDTITLVTYEGLAKIGFSKDINDDLISDLADIIVTGTSDKTARQNEKNVQKMYEYLGSANMNTVLDIDVCGFDYITFDEAHNFKNIFGSIPTDKDHKNIWRIPEKKPSARGTKAMILSLYIQKKFGGNICLLTATPFTNSPLEIFSMMALCGFEMLKKFNYQNLYEFVETFIETQVEYTVNYLNEIELQTVIKSFKNKNILRELVYKLFDYKDDPEAAEIKRPCKINYPNNEVSTYLSMSEKQVEVQSTVKEIAASYDPKTNRGAIGRALAMAKNNALSPYLATAEKEGKKTVVSLPDDLEIFIDDSPKIKYVVECIKTIHDWHSERGQIMSGQVIYSNRGIALFDSIKEYMEEYIGFRRNIKFGDEFVDEVELIIGGGSEAEINKKETIKDAFNKGYVKVIIGTGTIKEGVNLQERGTVLYNIDLDWNPTDFKQLEGRIHRQGNIFGFVRIVVPLVQNTLDSFIFQKLDEKERRISSIWDKKNDSNTLEDYVQVDPAEIKMELIDDVDELVKMYRDKEYRASSRELSIAKENQKAVYEIDEKLYMFRDAEKNLLQTLNNKNIPNILRYKQKIELYIQNNILPGTTKKKKEDFEGLLQKVEEVYHGLVSFMDNKDYKAFFEILRQMKSRKYQLVSDGVEFSYDDWSSPFDVPDYWKSSMISRYGDLKKIERLILMPNGFSMEDDISPLKTRLDAEVERIKTYINYLDSQEYKMSLIVEIGEKIAKKAEKRGDIMDRVMQFAEKNYLLSYPFKGVNSEKCVIPSGEYEGKIQDAINESKEPENPDLVSVVGTNMDTMKIEKPHRKPDQKAELKKKLSKIRPYFQVDQYKIVSSNVLEFEEPINRLYDVIEKMPSRYDDEKTPINNKMVYLHYFTSSGDWYIVEKGVKPEPLVAFGFANLFGEPELGYIDIRELAANKYVNLDFYWSEKKWGEIIGEPEEIVQSIAQEELALSDLEDMLESAILSLKYASEDEKEEIQNEIDSIKLTIKYL